jgi:phage-related holin
MKSVTLGILTTLQDPLLWVKGGLIFLIGPLNLQITYLLLALGIDLAFGIQIAVRNQTFRWRILFTKLRHKIMIYALWISMFHAFDMVTGLPDSARWAVIVLLAGLEMMSAIKNTARLGHNQLADSLERLYLSLAKSNSKTQFTNAPVNDAQSQIPSVPNVGIGDALGAALPGEPTAEGGRDYEPR